MGNYKTESSRRLNELLFHLGIKYSQLASAIGVQTQVLYNVDKGFSEMSRKISRKIVEKYPYVSEGWLLCGEGNMIKSGAEMEEAARKSGHSDEVVQNLQKALREKDIIIEQKDILIRQLSDILTLMNGKIEGK